ncbi:MAG: PfkB family carbohydrate kinase [Chitinophagaceae bacterium]|jgi:sugar/nucleoside kinase (ribokinase family)|nr:PfkB family carbohydrate kinase [Chitinophagaceae bacterium]
MLDICCIGHITLDKVVTPQHTTFMPGGTSFYFSNAIRNLDIRYLLITAVAENEMVFVEELRKKGINVSVFPSKHTVHFENIYPGNSDHRIQKVSQKADPFTVEQLDNAEAKIFHLGPLLADDFSIDEIKKLSAKGMVSLDVQGFLRKVENENVIPVDWHDKKEALQFVTILKANEYEMEILTGSAEVRKSAKMLHSWGVKEVVITLGSKGSVLYNGEQFYKIPAYLPTCVTDATGCGDTYMAGYLYQRAKGASIQDAGNFAAAMATIKIENSGPFTGTKEEVLARIREQKFSSLPD